jgi:DnaK suppressor protein
VLTVGGMSKPVQHEPDELSKAQLEELRELLLERRRGLDERRRPRDSEIPERQADEMDAATDATAEAESLGLFERNARIRKEIDRALAKFESGTYGVSEDSGEPIGFGRLRILPWARLTVQEEEAKERRRR